MIAATTLVHTSIFLGLNVITGHAAPPITALLRLTMYEIAFNMVLMVLLFPVLTWLSRKTGQALLPLE